MIQDDEISVLADNIGAKWKAVGLELGFKAAQLDQYEADTRTMFAAVRRMLFRWAEWRDQEATVRHLTKALFKNGEYEAIRCLEP